VKRRTSALILSAAALLATAPLLTGCSTDAHPGAAAVVGGERISLASVQAQVDQVRDAQRALPEADDLVAASSGLTRDTVNFLVYLEVLERAAENHGVEVTRHDVQQARRNAEDNVGGPEALAQAALVPQGGLPLAGDEQIDTMLRSQLLYQHLAERLGAMSAPNGQQMLIDELARTAEEIGVEINPRYGEWDAARVTLVPGDEPWIRAATGEAGQEDPAALS
jgi:hypothetical protein